MWPLAGNPTSIKIINSWMIFWLWTWTCTSMRRDTDQQRAGTSQVHLCHAQAFGARPWDLSQLFVPRIDSLLPEVIASWPHPARAKRPSIFLSSLFCYRLPHLFRVLCLLSFLQHVPKAKQPPQPSVGQKTMPLLTSYFGVEWAFGSNHSCMDKPFLPEVSLLSLSGAPWEQAPHSSYIIWDYPFLWSKCLLGLPRIDWDEM